MYYKSCDTSYTMEAVAMNIVFAGRTFACTQAHQRASHKDLGATVGRGATFSLICISKKIASVAVCVSLIAGMPSANAASKNDTQFATMVVDHIIKKDSQGWWLNRYNKGSVGNVRMDASLNNSRDGVITADFIFNDNQTGSVQVVFRNGDVSCVQYWDESTCRPVKTGPAPWGEALATVVLVGAAVAVGAAASKASRGSEYTSYSNPETRSRVEYYPQTTYQAPNYAPAVPTRPISNHYGDCHNPMGC